ncbi:MAG: hypothetical protein ABIJ23_03965 [Candidatus Magasanikbacteria bacterium]
MFSKNKKNKDLSLLIFGLIAFLIILATVLILVIFLSKVSNSKSTNTKAVVKQQVEEYIQETSVILLKDNYLSKIQNLYDEIKLKSEPTDIYETVSEAFFSIKVPEEYLNKHLEIWLQIDDLDKKDNLSKDEVLSLLNNLIEK